MSGLAGKTVQSCLLLLASAPGLRADVPAIDPALRSNAWPAHWIAHPTDPEQGYGVYRFRKRFDLAVVPEHFVVHVSGDRRYRLWANGTSVSVGPQRSDAYTWHYETVDLAPQLHAGSNVLAATVWNYGEDHPVALPTVRTAFILQGDQPAAAVVNTDGSWRVYREGAYAPLSPNRAALHTYLVVGPGDRIDGRRMEWDWAQPGFDDSTWIPARTLKAGTPEAVGTELDWWLAPRTVPLPFEREEKFAAIRRQSGAPMAEDFVGGGAPWIVPAHQHAVVLLDRGFETSAYPQLQVSGGAGAVCHVTYAEALVDNAGVKGNRNEVDGRHIQGLQDEFISGGGAGQVFSTLTYRTYRYVELQVDTDAAPLTVERFAGRATGYPFDERGGFGSDDPRLQSIWQVGVRTARLCAYETYLDCPYYEQMQYVGDTRIQSLISLYAFGDDRLVRNAIDQFDRSRLWFGLTQSRFPTTAPQVIPTFSLFWIEMVHDYWMLRADDPFVRQRMAGIRSVVGWFEDHVDRSTGLLGPLPYWNFVDWPSQWVWVDSAHPGGQPAGVREGGSAIVSLQFAWTLQHAAELADAYGSKAEAARWRELSRGLAQAARERCWDPARRLFADTPAKTSWSQHANTFAVLAGAVTGDEARDLIARIRSDETLTEATLYFRFYLLRAARQVGLGDDYVASLGPWLTMLDRGLTTFAEKPDPTRSDCHAWSASPVYELLATVCGVEPGAPGFRSVTIEPHLGALREASCRVPHPKGMITVVLKRDGQRLRAEVDLPGTVSGEFRWGSASAHLHPGHQLLALDRK